MINYREIFTLALRIIGAIILLYGAKYLFDFVLGQLEYFKLQHTEVRYYLVIGIAFSGVGLYFLQGARHLVDYCYPFEKEYQEEQILDEAKDENAE